MAGRVAGEVDVHVVGIAAPAVGSVVGLLQRRRQGLMAVVVADLAIVGHHLGERAVAQDGLHHGVLGIGRVHRSLLVVVVRTCKRGAVGELNGGDGFIQVVGSAGSAISDSISGHAPAKTLILFPQLGGLQPEPIQFGGKHKRIIFLRRIIATSSIAGIRCGHHRDR